MFRKLLLLVFVVGITGYAFAGAVPQKPARESGTITDEQAKNNLGQFYQVSFTSTTTDGSDIVRFLIDLTSATFTRDRVHITIKPTSDCNAIVSLYENPTVGDSSGTALIPYSKNRELADSPQTEFFVGSSVTATGTLLSTRMISDHMSAPELRGEWIVSGGNSYLLTILNTIGGTSQNDIGVVIEFFETLD